ncbi:MAG: hypothetical protein IJT21_02055 [Synergistaceae bacterium]|nr:hypothetical protein [Synergistaceae bacterium]
MNAKKFFPALIIIFISSAAYALSNSADAFMSLPFGHTYARTQKRMQNSGARVVTPRKDSLTMEGMFEGYPATFIFSFYKQKVLKTKAAYLQSMGDAEKDRQFYELLQKGFNRAYGSGNERPRISARNSRKLILSNAWTPDRYTTITMTYNPEASKRFPGSSINNRFIQIIYKSEKWD